MKRIFTVLALAATMALGACKEETAANRIYVFSQPGCPHCEHAEEYISRYYRNYDIERLNIREGNNMGYLLRYAKKFKVSEQSLGTPFIVMGDKYIMGWGNQQVKDFNRYAKNFKPKSSPLRSVAAPQMRSLIRNSRKISSRLTQILRRHARRLWPSAGSDGSSPAGFGLRGFFYTFGC